MEGVVTQIEKVPGVAMRSPILFLGIGLAFLVLTLLLESWKPGLLTGPINRLLIALHLKAA